MSASEMLKHTLRLEAQPGGIRPELQLKKNTTSSAVMLIVPPGTVLTNASQKRCVIKATLPNGTELHPFALKAQAGFGKGGEKNFEGTLTELEMQSYLCIGDFRQRTNKKGQLYGWHIAIITPPETKLGYDRIAEAYREAPENSWRRITEQIQSFFPEATDDQLLKLQKLLGIRR